MDLIVWHLDTRMDYSDTTNALSSAKENFQEPVNAELHMGTKSTGARGKLRRSQRHNKEIGHTWIAVDRL